MATSLEFFKAVRRTDVVANASLFFSMLHRRRKGMWACHHMSIRMCDRSQPNELGACGRSSMDLPTATAPDAFVGDGYLVPAKKDQPPPDLRYFGQPAK